VSVAEKRAPASWESRRWRVFVSSLAAWERLQPAVQKLVDPDDLAQDYALAFLEAERDGADALTRNVRAQRGMLGGTRALCAPGVSRTIAAYALGIGEPAHEPKSIERVHFESVRVAALACAGPITRTLVRNLESRDREEREQTERREALEVALSQISRADWSIIIDLYVFGMPIRELAEIEGVTRAEIYARRSAALARLRARVDEQL
jgi:hypothetical protein